MSAEVKIKTLFSEAMFSEFQKRRFGLKNCANNVDLELAHDLMELYTVSNNLSQCSPKEAIACCPLCEITEKIQTI